MLNMAIVGHGFVGSAVDYGFDSPSCYKYIVDPKGGLPIGALETIDIDITFICVPTPMGADGTIDSSILESCLDYLIENVSGIKVVKSTVTPDILEKYKDKIVYNPEFLTEKSANEDFVNPVLHVFGGLFELTKEVEQIYEQYSNCKPCPVFHMSITDASFVKYGINSYLASKVLWFNQFFDVVSTNNANYGKILGAMTSDPRVGISHTMVPGFDGKRGFSGSCFPKDSWAFAKFAKISGTDFTVLEEVIRRNQDYRKNSGISDREKEQNIRFDLKL